MKNQYRESKEHALSCTNPASSYIGKIYHIKDMHKIPAVQAAIADKILDLHKEGKIQAVFCEGVEYAEEAELIIGDIPFYGTESVKLNQKYCHAFIRRCESEESLERVQNEIKGIADISEAEKLLKLVKKVENMEKIYDNNICNEKKYSIVRSKYMVTKTVSLSQKKGFENVALVCGAGHKKEIEKFSEEKRCEYIPVKIPFDITEKERDEYSKKHYEEEIIKLKEEPISDFNLEGDYFYWLVLKTRNLYQFKDKLHVKFNEMAKSGLMKF